jgi:hypothetical protein
MPGPVYLTIANGQTVSSAFTLERSDRCLVIEVPSYGTAASLLVHFTATSGTAPFSPPFRRDGAGAPHTVFSGTAGGWGSVYPMTPYGRLVLGASQSAVMTFTLNLWTVA